MGFVFHLYAITSDISSRRIELDVSIFSLLLRLITGAGLILILWFEFQIRKGRQPVFVAHKTGKELWGEVPVLFNAWLKKKGDTISFENVAIRFPEIILQSMGWVIAGAAFAFISQSTSLFAFSIMAAWYLLNVGRTVESIDLRMDRAILIVRYGVFLRRRVKVSHSSKIVGRPEGFFSTPAGESPSFLLSFSTCFVQRMFYCHLPANVGVWLVTALRRWSQEIRHQKGRPQLSNDGKN